MTGKRLQGQERDELKTKVVSHYVAEEMPIRSVAKLVGCSYGLVQKLLEEARVEPRSRGHGKAVVTEQNRAQLRDRFKRYYENDGLSIAEISLLTGKSRELVRTCLREGGVTMRPRGRRKKGDAGVTW